MVYDPRQLSYAELLEVFWQLHDPSSRPYLRQYRNAIFYIDQEQKREAELSAQKLELETGRPVRTAIEAAGDFTPAEDYHQKHFLQKRKPLFELLRQRYPDLQELFRSTEAAHLNGLLGCNGDPQHLGREIRALALPDAAEQELFDSLTLTCRGFRGSGCSLPPRQLIGQPATK